jgi:hypothetical protein
MKGLRNAYVAPMLAALLVLSTTQWAGASSGPKWSVAELTNFADAVVTGRVESIATGWDPAVNTIYTYVTIDVDEVYKGAIDGGRIVIKQLGGRIGDFGLVVADQPTFGVGEEVLLYLEVRPRDQSLYTAALWQGKWTLEAAANGERVAARQEPAHAGALATVDRHALASVRASVAAAATDPDAALHINVAPSDAAFATPQPFVLLGPFRYLFNPPVDVQAGGQPGLAGGGFAQLANSVARWNAAGAAFQYLAGSNSIGPRCTTTQLGNSRITISFMDPCGEISNSGGTLAIGGSYAFATGGGTVNGVAFGQAIEGFIVNNDSATALNFLQNANCFSDVELHELGHVFGLGHSADNAAIMFASVSFAVCSAAAGGRNLHPDDVAGIRFIYPGGGGGGTPGTPTVTGASGVPGGLLTVTWSSGGGAAPTSHVLQFFQGGALLATVPHGPSTTFNFAPLPPGLVGAFAVRVQALNGPNASAFSAPFPFNIGSGCTVPTAPAVSGGVVGSTASISWPPVTGAVSYLVSAGSTAGATDVLPPTNIGGSTGASASPVPPGFRVWVRVQGVNACGTAGAFTDFEVK